MGIHFDDTNSRENCPGVVSQKSPGLGSLFLTSIYFLVPIHDYIASVIVCFAVGNDWSWDGIFNNRTKQNKAKFLSVEGP